MTQSKMIRKNTQLGSHRERGQAFVLIGLSLIFLIAAVGLATDATILYRTKQNLQRALDSAALAAAYKLPNRTNASKAAYEFGRLHGYDFDPTGNKLTIDFPVYDPPRKAVKVAGSTTLHFAFLSILGFHTMQVSAQGEAEAAPMDVYLVFDLSQSMVYDTPKPSPFPPSDFNLCSTWDSSGYSDCVAKYCNWARECDPLDAHLKPAAKYFIDQLDPAFDRIGVVAYHQFGYKVIGLTNNFNAVKTAIDDLNAFDRQGTSDCDNTSPAGSCNKNTNIGDGVMVAHTNIAAEGRMDAIWSIVLETDGRTNIWRSCSGCPPDCEATGCQTLYGCWNKDDCTDNPNPIYDAINWAINNAKDTWNRHETVIYTIAYGDIFFTDPTNQALMTDIADWTDNGIYDGTTNNFWAVATEAQLKQAFGEIADRIYSRLLR
jgi:hypothetical protein